MERKMFDTPVLPRLETILAEVRSGDLVVPDFQRPFVWDDDQRLSLMDSISQGMPIGSLLVWRTSKHDLKTYESLAGIRFRKNSGSGARINYLLDGHQRISTLFGALQPGPRDVASGEDDTRWPLYYELGATDRPAFRLKPHRGPAPSHWLPLDILFDGDALFEFTKRLRENKKGDLARDAEKLANIFRDYIIPIVPLVTEELAIVTDAFVRINSQGKKMSEAHMLRALTHDEKFDTAAHFEIVHQRLGELGWSELDDQVLINTLKTVLGLHIYTSDMRKVREELKNKPQILGELANATEEAANTLVNLGVLGPNALPYAYQFVAVAAFAAHYPHRLEQPEVLEKLRRWFWITTYTEHFTGTTGRRTRDSIKALAEHLHTGAPLTGFDTPVEPLRDFRMSSVRGRAFLLFLAQLPPDEKSRRRRQELLANDETRNVAKIFPNTSGEDPANRVIADPDEARTLRSHIVAGQMALPGWAEEYGIPTQALGRSPEAFLDMRRKWLRECEEAFIQSFGGSDPPATP